MGVANSGANMIQIIRASPWPECLSGCWQHLFYHYSIKLTSAHIFQLVLSSIFRFVDVLNTT